MPEGSRRIALVLCLLDLDLRSRIESELLLIPRRNSQLFRPVNRSAPPARTFALGESIGGRRAENQVGPFLFQSAGCFIDCPRFWWGSS